MDITSLGAHPAWLPEESFFSLCSRLHFLSGHLHPGATSRLLFSLSERCIKHDLPCGLDAFERNTAGRWGGAISIIEHRTIFPFFSPFRSHSSIAASLAQMANPVVGSLKYQLGLVCGGFGADHPLRACPSCMMRDLDLHGVSYWHMAHQYPGVVVCPEHREVLCECFQNRRWSGRFTWTLPDPGTLRDMGYGEINAVEQERLVQLAAACGDLRSMGLAKHFDPIVVAQIYRQCLPTENAARSLLAHISPLRRFHPYGEQPSTYAAAASFISQMVRAPRRHIHPLKHLIMITWLFGEVSLFARCYESRFTQHEPLPVFPASTPTAGAPAPAGKRGQPRPKRLKLEFKTLVLNRLAEGAAKDNICREFKLNISTVNKLLRTEPCIQASWTARRTALDKADHRLRWAQLQGRFPSHSLTELRRECQSLYIWLYRNDREWLNAQAGEMLKPARNQALRVDWEGRDDGLLRELEAEIARRFGSDLNQGLKQSQIFSLIPRLAQRLERRDRYPRTRAYMKLLSRR